MADVFISYSRKNKDWLDRLQIMLKPYIRGGLFDAWDDTKIKTGDRWKGAIEKALLSASVAILLVTPEFLASDFIAQEELPPLLKKAEEDGLTIFWIAVSYSAYERTSIKDYQCANNPATPLDSLGISDQNRVLVSICEEIAHVLSSSRDEIESNPSIPIVENAIKNLDNADSRVRMEAIQTLKSTQHRSAHEALLGATRHFTVDVRKSAIQALHSFTDERTYEALETVATNTDEDVEIRALAVEGLKNSTLPSSFEVALVTLKNPDIIVASLEVLLAQQWQNNSALIEPLVNFWMRRGFRSLNIYSDNVQRLHNKSIEVLAAFGEATVQVVLDIVEEYKSFSMEEKLSAHLEAFAILVAIRSEAAREAYAYFVDKDNYGSYSEYFDILQPQAALVLADLGDKRAGPALIEAHKNHWTSGDYLTEPRNGIWDTTYSRALDKLNYPYKKEDPWSPG